MYTDGLVERRDRPVDDGIGQASACLAGHPDEAPGVDIVESLIADLVGGRVAEDDIAVLVVQHPGRARPAAGSGGGPHGARPGSSAGSRPDLSGAGRTGTTWSCGRRGRVSAAPCRSGGTADRPGRSTSRRCWLRPWRPGDVAVVRQRRAAVAEAGGSTSRRASSSAAACARVTVRRTGLMPTRHSASSA